MRKSQNGSIFFKSIMAFILGMGILLSTGIIGDTLRLHMLLSFTNLSNVYILVVTLLSLYQLMRQGNISERLYRGRILGLIIILLTGIVYHFILLPQRIHENPNYQVFTIANTIIHYVAPFLMLLDWVMFDVKGKMQKKDPLIFISLPIVYFVIFCSYGYCGLPIPNRDSSYIYFFMDLDALGIWGVSKWIVIILLYLIVLVYGIYLLDTYFGRDKRFDWSILENGHFLVSLL